MKSCSYIHFVGYLVFGFGKILQKFILVRSKAIAILDI